MEKELKKPNFAKRFWERLKYGGPYVNLLNNKMELFFYEVALEFMKSKITVSLLLRLCLIHTFFVLLARILDLKRNISF